ncbi:MAG: DUF4255 domain-containing protein [Chloroflexi bacterium]|nr:DUF4255 domain-containing protein [Chloroflexota bacterium]
MLHLLDASIEAYLRGEVPLDDRVDVDYDAPDSTWSAGITRPTVNVFAWDIRRNSTETTAGFDIVQRGNDRFHKAASPRIDFRYLITTWTQQSRDEHELLGAILVACLRLPAIPVQYLQGPLAEVDPPPRLQVARFDDTQSSEFWSSMGGQLKAALDIIVSATVDTELLRPAGPPVRSLRLESTSPDQPARRSVRTADFGDDANGSPA